MPRRRPARRPRWPGARLRRPRSGPRSGARPRGSAAALAWPVPSPGPTTIDPNRAALLEDGPCPGLRRDLPHHHLDRRVAPTVTGGRQADVAGSAAHRRPRREGRRAGHAGRSTHDPHRRPPLVRVSGPVRPPSGDVLVGDQTDVGPSDVESDVGDLDRAGEIGAVPEEETRLQGGERHRGRRTCRRSAGPAGEPVHAGGDVDREHGHATGVGEGVGPAEARSVRGVDDEVGHGETVECVCRVDDGDTDASGTEARASLPARRHRCSPCRPRPRRVGRRCRRASATRRGRPRRPPVRPTPRWARARRDRSRPSPRGSRPGSRPRVSRHREFTHRERHRNRRFVRSAT